MHKVTGPERVTLGEEKGAGHSKRQKADQWGAQGQGEEADYRQAQGVFWR